MDSIITLGADPELFLHDEKEDKIISSIPVLKCHKNNPIDLKDGYRMYSDNVLVEFAMPPARGPYEFEHHVQEGLNRMRTYLHNIEKDRYNLWAKAAHVFEPKDLDTPEAWEIGCNPNFDAYSKSMNLPKEFRTGLRTGSFHLHIGCEAINTTKTREEAVKLLDTFLGCASVLFDNDPTSKTRRSLYGGAGEFRPTPYGIEWRVLGNWPLRHKEAINLCAQIAIYAINQLGKTIYQDDWGSRVQLAINTCDRVMAKRILEVAGLPHDLMRGVEADYTIQSELT